MGKIIHFKNNLKHFLDLIDKRQQENDLWGVLDASRNAKNCAKTRIEKDGLNLLIGQAYFDMGQYALSLEFFFRTLHIPHIRSSAFFGIARNLVCIKKFALALDYLDATLKWDISNTFTGAVLEWTYDIKEKINDPEIAKENLIFSAKNLISKKDFAGAKEILSGLKSDEENQSLLAICNFFEENFSIAESLAKEVLSLNPENVSCLCLLCMLYEKTGKQHLAKKYQNRVYLIETDIPEDLRRIGLLFASKNEFDKSYIFLEKLIQIEEFNAKNHLFCALCAYNLGKKDDALFHISKARWLDNENPLYLFFFQLIKTDDLPSQTKISAELPQEIANEKIKNLIEIFFGGNFNNLIEKSYFLLDDVLWAFSLKDLDLTDKCSNALANCNNKKAQRLLKNIMLSPKPTVRQKFLITKNALLANKMFNIEFVCNLKYSSFQITKNDLAKIKNKNLKNALCSAISFAECFFQEQMLLNDLIKKCQSLKAKHFDDLSENALACLLLFDNPKIFKSACTFFDVEENQILTLKNGMATPPQNAEASLIKENSKEEQ